MNIKDKISKIVGTKSFEAGLTNNWERSGYEIGFVDGIKWYMEQRTEEDNYVKCKKCDWENYIDPTSEIPENLYKCDECGTKLKDD